MDLVELIDKVKQNDQAAFEELYNAYYPMGFSLALQFVKNEEEAMDIMQDAFITVCTKLDSLEDTNKFKSWYMQIVANKCRDFLKKKNPLSFTDANAYDEDGNLQFDIEDDDREFQPEESVDYTETVRIVNEMLDELPEDQKMCLLLYYVNSLKISEIAESLGISEATVKSRLKYGKEKLKVQVEDYENKNGIKLRGISGGSVIPFVKWLFSKEEVTDRTKSIAVFSRVCEQVNVLGIPNATSKVLFVGVDKLSVAEFVKTSVEFLANHKVGTATVTAITAATVAVGGVVVPLSKKPIDTNSSYSNNDVAYVETIVDSSQADVSSSFIESEVTDSEDTSSEVSSIEDVSSEVTSSEDTSTSSTVSEMTSSEDTLTSSTVSEETSSEEKVTSSSEISESSKTDTSNQEETTSDLEVLDIWFDENNILNSMNGTILCGSRNGLYGAVDLKGNEIIPFKYDGVTAPTSDGYVLATYINKKIIGEKKYNVYNSYLYNSSGKIVYSAEAVNEILVYNKGKKNEWSEESGYYTGEKISHYNDGVLITKTANENTNDKWSDYLHLKKPDGTLIKTYSKVIGFCGFKNGKMAISFYDVDDENIIVIDKTGEVLHKTRYYHRNGVAVLKNSWASGFSGGCILARINPTDAFLIFSQDLSAFCKFNTSNLYNKELEAHFEIDTYYGKHIISKNNKLGKYMLVKILDSENNNIDFVNNKVYDSISIDDGMNEKSTYALVEYNGKWGYLSLENYSEKFYEDAGHFVNGKAIVKEKGKVFIINEKFEKISDELGDDIEGIVTLGDNLYSVTINGKSHPVVFNP